MSKCSKCKRTEIFFEGCSVVDCPKRKALTASYTEIITSESENIGCYIKKPTMERSEDDEKL